MINRIREKAKQDYPRLVRFLRDIVAIPSPSGKEKKVSSRIRKEMRDAGFDRVDVDSLGSVIGQIGKGKIKILYDAHIDTVNIGNIKNWRYNPYGSKHKNGIVYGRGACDDKGSVAALIYAGRLIKRLRLEDNYTLYITASVREELAEGEGIKYAIKCIGVRPDYIIIAEPSNLNIIRGHKGRVGLKITTKGNPVHASTPEKGINAIYRMTPLLRRIDELNKKFRLNSPLGKGVISITEIKSHSSSHNTIPYNCTVYLDRRTTDKESKEKVIKELRRIAGRNNKVEIVDKFFPAWILEKEHPLVKSAVKTYKILFGKQPNICLWPFCTNGSYTMGNRKIPTIGFGPGEAKFAHVANEQIKTKEVLQAVTFYATFPKLLVNTVPIPPP